MMSNEVYYYENFLSEDLCDWFVSFHNVFYRMYGIVFSDRQILNFTKMIDILYLDEKKQNVTDYLKQVEADLTCNVRKHDQNAYINYTHLTAWKAPIYQPVHLDFEEHAWTSVLYLNDNFDGGCTIVGGEKVSPKKGDLILFTGSSILHGVEEVTKGTRYTITSWYKSKTWK